MSQFRQEPVSGKLDRPSLLHTALAPYAGCEWLKSDLEEDLRSSARALHDFLTGMRVHCRGWCVIRKKCACT